MKRWLLTASLCTVMSTAYSDGADRTAEAARIARDSLIVDTHIDVPYRLREQWADVTRSTDAGDFDYPRARRGGLDVPFMSIYTPAESELDGSAWQLANELIDAVEALVGRAPGRFRIVTDTDSVEAAHRAGLMGLALGMENGAPIGGSLEALRHFHQRGIRYVTLTHSKSNHIADSSYDEERRWNGLSPFGRELVAEMNRLGIMVDISHVSDEAFYDVLDVSRAPVIASHSSARHFTPGFERNMSDDMIRALAKHGGVIQINFGSSFVTAEARDWYDVYNERRAAWSQETGHPEEGEEATAWEAEYREENPFPYAALADVADHFDHVISLVGADHVGIGSDYDGVGDSLPEGLKDVSTYPALVREFLDRGYSREDIEGILGGNLMRVWAEVERVATDQSR